MESSKEAFQSKRRKYSRNTQNGYRTPLVAYSISLFRNIYSSPWKIEQICKRLVLQQSWDTLRGNEAFIELANNTKNMIFHISGIGCFVKQSKNSQVKSSEPQTHWPVKLILIELLDFVKTWSYINDIYGQGSHEAFIVYLVV